MVNPGKALCHHCGMTSNILIYKSQETTLTLTLTRTKTDKLLLSYIVPSTLTEETRGFYNDIDKVVFFDTHGNLYKGRIPDYIRVNIIRKSGQSKDKVHFERCCQHCGKPLFNGIGTLPLYVIGVVGHTFSGKSCWIHAVHTPANLISVTNNRYNCCIRALELSEGNKNIQATHVTEVGETCLISVFDQQKEKNIAHIMLVDIAGEAFYPENRETFHNSAVGCFINGNIIDAFVFMDSLTDTVNDSSRIYNAINAYNVNILSAKPVAYVLNKYDKVELVDSWYKYEDIPSWDENAVHVNTMRIFDSNTFTIIRGCALDNFKDRVALQNSIALRYSDVAKLIQTTNQYMKGFVVKTCKPDGEENYGNSDYYAPINVMDPLIYLLNCLRLLPIERVNLND